MEAEKEVIIYVNAKQFGKKNLLPSKNLEELRIDLEKVIPNHIYFEKGGKSLKQEEEKFYNIKNILNENNSIFLSQDYFHVFFDGKDVTKKVDFYKKDSFTKLMSVYQKELTKNFMIRCESNLLIQIIKYSIDNNILIDEILIGNSIYMFSANKIKDIENNIQKGSLSLFIKNKNNISFENIRFKEMKIFYSSLIDDDFMKDIKETEYEIRKKNSLLEYEKYKNSSPDEEKLEKIILENNTNDNAIFDYLMLLKNNKSDKFKQKLEKYSFHFGVDKLRQLDSKYNEQIYENYKDEKTNLVNFLEKVINGEYDDYYDNVDLILSEVDYSVDIQKNIISPFIGNFNKEIYINIPISLSDNNLFFHYLRVKFYRYLQYSFGESRKPFVKYCKILLQKIKNINTIQHPKLQKKLLLEILCMVCIFGFHNIEKEGVIDYYNCFNTDTNEYYYHSIIFFLTVKNILLGYFKMIGNSNCMSTALIEYKKEINIYAKNNANLDIKNSIDILIRNTVFLPFFSKDDWGFTIPAFNLSFINIDIYDFQANYNSYPDYIFLFYFIKYIISFLYEPIGHNFKIYESFNEKLETPFNTPQILEKGKETTYVGGYLMEILLINSIEKLNIEHVLFLLNEKNWTLDHKDFLKKFKEIGAPDLQKCMIHIKTGNMMLKLLSLFQINENSIKNAIKENTQLSTQINKSFKNDLEIQSSNEKYRKAKIEKGKNGRICRTHYFYK